MEACVRPDCTSLRGMEPMRPYEVHSRTCPFSSLNFIGGLPFDGMVSLSSPWHHAGT